MTKMAYSDCQLPKNWRTTPPSVDEIPPGICVIQCDASYKNGITGISTMIRGSNKQYKPIEHSARTKGPVHAELTAILKAITRLLRLEFSKEVRKVLIYTDCRYAYFLLKEVWAARRDYIMDVLSKIEELIDSLGEGVDVVVLHTKSACNRRVDRRAKKKRKSIEERKKQQIAERIESVEKSMIRSREIMIVEVKNEYRALPRKNGFPPGYLVTLNPPSCECPWWKHNWANKGDRTIRARALPCKHICALAEYLESSIYDVFGKQIGRLD